MEINMEAVRLDQLTKKFGDFTAVNRISLTIQKGKIYGFLGPNGSGKSTTIRMLCGILEPTSGTGSILGLDIRKDAEAIKTKIGYMSQKFSLYNDLNVRENLDFYAGMYSLPRSVRQERIAAMIAMAGLEGREKELTANLYGGWNQPPILFLDEPTGGVDPKSRRMFWDIIYSLAHTGTTVMVTTHFMDEAEHCDEIGFIFEGNLIATDTPQKIKQSIPGSFIEIPSEAPMELLREIQDRRLPLLDAYVFGAGLHVLTYASQLDDYSGYPYVTIIPSLEDVFVYYVKTNRKGLIA
jgi:ABC-2 type transport system ATP-binding protein